MNVSTCEQCAVEFLPSCESQRFCSATCRRTAAGGRRQYLQILTKPDEPGCEICGAPTRVSRRGRAPLRCAEHAIPKARTSTGKCITCGAVVVRQKQRGPLRKRCAVCDTKWRVKKMVSCQSCGSLYERIDRQKYCSAACEESARSVTAGIPQNLCAFCLTDISVTVHNKRFCSEKCRAADRNRRRPPTRYPERACEVCLAPYAPTYAAQRTCSRSCGVDLKRWVTGSIGSDSLFCTVRYADCLQCGNAFIVRWARTCCSSTCRAEWQKTDARAALNDKQCVECGVHFLGTARRRFCSPSCGNRAARRTARHRRRENSVVRGSDRRRQLTEQRGESFTTLEIANRDGWRCHLCGKKVRRDNWSIDHLVPICAGGEHTRVNVAIAHKTCNERRRQFGEVQLRLVG